MIIGFATLLLFPSFAWATHPCHADLLKHCPGLKGKGRAQSICLLKNEGQLSPGCAKDFAGKKDKIIAHEPCAQDLADKCYAELAGEPGLAFRCLLGHKGKLLARCEVATTSKMQKMRARNPCFDDTEKFCPGTVNLGAIDQCLESKLAQLNPACRKRMDKEISLGAKSPCRRDARILCPKLIGAPLENCLRSQETKISPACRQIRDKHHKTVKQAKEACELDRVKFCALEPRQGKRIKACLHRNRRGLSKACASALAQ